MPRLCRASSPAVAKVLLLRVVALGSCASADQALGRPQTGCLADLRGSGSSGGGPQAALAMQGGGFRALAADAGLVAGLLAAAGRQKGSLRPKLAGSGLFDRFCLLSTVSGSSWFTSQLLYSRRFLELVESMAENPWIVAYRFREGWTYHWLRATDIDAPLFDVMGDVARLVVRALLGSGDEDTILLARFLVTTGISWNHFVHTLMNSTAGIDDIVSLGSAVNAWAEGKVWLVDHTAVTPSGSKLGRFYQAPFGTPLVGYKLRGLTLRPTVDFQPARFSIVLGAGTNSSAPLPYMSGSALPLRTRLVYEAQTTVAATTGSMSASSGPLGGEDLAHGNLERFAGALPVIGAVAASSAFIGSGLMLGPLVAQAESFISAQLTPWVSSAPGGRAFKEADELVGDLRGAGGVSQEAIERLASAVVRGVIDGGFCDGTGIAEAVAAGADEVVVLLNSNATNDPTYVDILFEGGPKPITPGKPAELFPIFEAPSSSAIRQAFEGFHRLRPSKSAKFLKVLAVGTIQATTAQNRFWGIDRGRKITLHIINIGSHLRIGLFEDFNNYNILTQEVATTVMELSNIIFVEKVLLPMFMKMPNATVRPPLEEPTFV